MSALTRRIAALEGAGEGLVLVLVAALPGEDRETATYAGMTYTQGHDETGEQFRVRLAECLRDGRKRFICVSAMDAAL